MNDQVLAYLATHLTPRTELDALNHVDFMTFLRLADAYFWRLRLDWPNPFWGISDALDASRHA